MLCKAGYYGNILYTRSIWDSGLNPENDKYISFKMLNVWHPVSLARDRLCLTSVILNGCLLPGYFERDKNCFGRVCIPELFNFHSSCREENQSFQSISSISFSTFIFFAPIILEIRHSISSNADKACVTHFSPSCVNATIFALLLFCDCFKTRKSLLTSSDTVFWTACRLIPRFFAIPDIVMSSLPNDANIIDWDLLIFPQSVTDSAMRRCSSIS